MPAAGHQTVLFDTYSRALSGHALSFDRRKLAVAITQEGAVAGFRPGLAIYDAVTGAVLLADPSFTGTVLGFSRDGSQLFTLSDTIVSALSTGDLHTLAQFSWPAGTAFLGVSPGRRCRRHQPDRADRRQHHLVRSRDRLPGSQRRLSAATDRLDARRTARRGHRRPGGAVPRLARPRRRGAVRAGVARPARRRPWRRSAPSTIRRRRRPRPRTTVRSSSPTRS